MDQPAEEELEMVESVGELDFAVVTLREFLHHSNAIRAVALVDREPGVGPATVDCERFCAIEVNLGDRVVLLDHGAKLEPAPPTLPEVKPLPPFNVNPISGEVAGTIGGLEHLVDGVSALAAALGGRNIAIAVFETDSAEHPLSITARADGSEEPVVAIGDQAFTLPPAPGTSAPPMRLIRVLCGPALVYAGIMHFVRPWFYKPMMPAWLPAHDELIFASGVTEVVAGAALICPDRRVRRAGGVLAILTLIGVFPANVEMATHPERFPKIPPAALWARLPLQAVMLAWVVAAMRPSRRD
jgi:uncharacterized membrane protein